MDVVAYDPIPKENAGFKYVTLDVLLAQSDVISLHCPLTEETRHIIGKDAFEKMKPGVILINTSRGALIDSEALVKALQSEKVRAAGLDVYEEEGDFFYEDFSNAVIRDELLSLLVTFPNVIITSHQAFLTAEALKNIAETTLANMKAFFTDSPLENEICYYCKSGGRSADCPHAKEGRCFKNAASIPNT
jgi:D-lactate dehydrogenase